MKLDDLIYRLKKRAEIRRQISTRKSVVEGKPDRIAELLEEAAAQLGKPKVIVLGEYSISEGTNCGLWFSHESGEGMQITEETLKAMFIEIAPELPEHIVKLKAELVEVCMRHLGPLKKGVEE